MNKFSDHYFDPEFVDQIEEKSYSGPVAEPYIGMHAAEFAILVGETVETGVGFFLALRYLGKLRKRVTSDIKRFTFVARWHEYESTVYWLIAYASEKAHPMLRKRAEKILGIMLSKLPYDIRDSPDDLEVAMRICTEISREVPQLEKQAFGCMIGFWGVQYAPAFVVDGQTPYLSDKTFLDVVVPWMVTVTEATSAERKGLGLTNPQLFTAIWMLCRWSPLMEGLKKINFGHVRDEVNELRRDQFPERPKESQARSTTAQERANTSIPFQKGARVSGQPRPSESDIQHKQFRRLFAELLFLGFQTVPIVKSNLDAFKSFSELLTKLTHAGSLDETGYRLDYSDDYDKIEGIRLPGHILMGIKDTPNQFLEYVEYEVNPSLLTLVTIREKGTAKKGLDKENDLDITGFPAVL